MVAPQHRIRLHGPWELRRPVEPPQRIKLPLEADFLIQDQHDSRPHELQFVRHFNWPHEIPPEEPVWLQVSAGLHWEPLQLNDQSITGMIIADPDNLNGGLVVTRYPVGPQLMPRNQITLRPAVEQANEMTPRIAEVCLLIG